MEESGLEASIMVLDENEMVAMKIQAAIEGSISSSIMMLGDEEAAIKILKLMRIQHPSVLVLSNEEHPTEAINDMVCQYLAELGLKEIMDTLKSVPVTEAHLYAGCVLVSIKDIHIVKKYMWRDKHFINTLARIVRQPYIDNEETTMFRDIIISTIQGLLFGGTPRSVLTTIANSDIISTFTDILQNRQHVAYPSSYDKLVLSLLVMCQDDVKCLHKCTEARTAHALGEFSRWDQLGDNEMRQKSLVASQCIHQMSHKDELPNDKKLILDKFSIHMQTKNKTYRRLETVKCSNRRCSVYQGKGKEDRFKKCSRCRLVLYCSKDCQKEHWITGHEELCVAPSKRVEKAEVD